MTTEDKLKTYKEGFRDGFDEGYKRGRVDADLLNPYKLPHPAPMENWTGCPRCGRIGMSGVVCNIPGCPRTAYSSISDLPTGANGPAG